MGCLKKIICLVFVLLVLVGADAFAQKAGNKTNVKVSRKQRILNRKSLLSADAGDRFFNNMDYFLAAKMYDKAYNYDTSNHYALFRLAETYMAYFEYDNAEKYYGMATEYALETYPLSRYWYGLMLKTNGKYKEAQIQFETFVKEYKDYSLEAEVFKEKAKQEAKGCQLALDDLSKPQRDYIFDLLKMPVNTPYSEYSPLIYHNDSTLVITSSRITKRGKRDNMFGGGFNDIYRFTKTEDGWKEVSNDDGFDIINSEYNESGGSFNRDLTKFYFTRCDEKVVVDGYEDFNCLIYLSRKLDGKWTKPEMLNTNINMPGQWNAQPSVSPDGDLMFFVSKRPGGLGMHDIWYSTSTGNEDWGPAMNMGDQINTMFIDMSPKYYPQLKALFFASNGHEVFGGLDIFKVYEDQFFDTSGVEIKNIGFPFNSNRDDMYFILGDDKGYVTSNREGGMGGDDIYTFNIRSNEALVAFVNIDSLLAEPETKSISILGTVLNLEDKNPAPDVEVSLTDEKSIKIKSTHTDDEGKFRFESLPTDQNYKVVMEDEDPNLTTEIKYVVKDVHVKSSTQEATKTLFENIYFSFDSYDLRPEAKKVLEELNDFYKEHPEIQVEMNANTDAIGSSEYNIKLSEKRGKSAMDYLINKGIPRSSLVTNALGQDNPIAANDNPYGRQLNRRVEFSIVGGPGYEANTMAYVVEPKTNIKSVAKKFNMTVEELKELNAMKDDQITAYRALRVKRMPSYDPDMNSMAVISKNTVQRMNLNSEKAMRAPAESVYIVRPKNTLFSIARLYGLTVDELKEMNNLTNSHIVIGQRLMVKTGKVPKEDIRSGKLHLVKTGDTLESIAQKYNLQPENLVELNAMELYRLQPNMVLKVK